jgi:regulator of sigma D
VIIRIIISLQSETLSIYEVQNSYIDTNINCTALILRQETIVDTDSSGYVSYYVRDGEKVGKNKTVYTIDETGSVYDKIKDSNTDALAITDEGLSEVRTRISNYENYFDYSSFSDVYNFRYDIENAVLELTNEAMIDQLTSLDNSTTNVSTYKKVNSNEAGIITYYRDGYENINIDNFKASDVNSSGYKKTTLKTGEIINSGDPVYKLVTSENWYLIAPLNDKQAEALADKVKVAIIIDNCS